MRLKTGASGTRFMEGQFGPGATPGAIWKIDGATGKAVLFAETVDGSTPNSGPALGDIAIDPASKSLFASDLDTGLIHRFPLEGGGTRQTTFDHGTTGRPAARLPAVADDRKRADIGSGGFNPADPKTWGFTQAGAAHRRHRSARRPPLLRGGIGTRGVVGRHCRRRQFRQRPATRSRDQDRQAISRLRHSF